ncbi:MAG: hypothetical protein ACYSWZ_04925 [Planctomycetota bacterium]|jgi:hypothetical protein
MAEKQKVIVGAVIGLLLVALVSCIFLLLRSTPPAQGISESLDEQDTSGQLSLKSISMPAPIYKRIIPLLEKTYSSTLALEVANSSDHEAYLGLQYYADSGRISYYSPGAISGARILTVPANWTGVLNFPIRHLRFVYGGNIQITIARCKKAVQDKSVHLPQDSETIIKKKYVLVPEQPKAKPHR